jgi:hypothetical protein
MKKLTIVLICCMAMTAVLVFHEPVLATLNTSPNVVPEVVGVLLGTGLVTAVVILLTSPSGDKDKIKAQLDEKNQFKATSASAITATAETTSTSANIDAASDTLEKKLKDLKALHDSKDITDEEYKQMKEKLLFNYK